MKMSLLTLQVMLALVYARSALAKIVDPFSFASAVTAFELGPNWIAMTFGFLVIPVEIGLALSHATGAYLASIGARVGLSVLAVFLIAVGATVFRGKQVECHCFGRGDEEMVSVKTVARLCALIVAEAILVWAPDATASMRSMLALGPSGLSTLCATVAAVIGVARLILNGGDVADVLRPCKTCRARSM